MTSFYEVIDEAKGTPGFWYLATPYSQYPYGVDSAFEFAADIAGKLARKGVRLFCPIAHSHPLVVAADFDLSHEGWMKYNEPFMQAAFGLIVAQMLEWDKSRGVKEEIEFFERAGKQILMLSVHHFSDAAREARG